MNSHFFLVATKISVLFQPYLMNLEKKDPPTYRPIGEMEGRVRETNIFLRVALSVLRLRLLITPFGIFKLFLLRQKLEVCLFAYSGDQHTLTIWVTLRVAYKSQELLALYGSLGSPLVFGGDLQTFLTKTTTGGVKIWLEQDWNFGSHK
jgi:hypothetical protein